jgi:hypothetical protein
MHYRKFFGHLTLWCIVSRRRSAAQVFGNPSNADEAEKVNPRPMMNGGIGSAGREGFITNT